MSDSKLKSSILLKINGHQKAKLTLIVLTVTAYKCFQNTDENTNDIQPSTAKSQAIKTLVKYGNKKERVKNKKLSLCKLYVKSSQVIDYTVQQKNSKSKKLLSMI